MDRRADPLGRLALAAGLLLVLLALVAIASRGGLGGGGGGPAADHALVDRLFTAFLVLLLLYIPIAGWIYWNQRRVLAEELAKRPRRGVLANLLLFAGFMVAALAIVRLRAHFGHPAGVKARGSLTTAVPPGRRGTPARDEYVPHFDWGAALLVGGVALSALLVLVFALVRRNRPQERGRDLSVAERLELALAQSLDDILAERDPRRAVIAAYARMERELGVAGVPRAPHEVPFEYVGRALRALAVGEGSVRRLTELYERARFSAHEIRETMRADAIAALTDVRAELRAGAT